MICFVGNEIEDVLWPLPVVTVPLWTPASAPGDEEGAVLERICGRASKIVRNTLDAAEAANLEKEAKLVARLPCSIQEQMLIAHAIFGPHATAPRDAGRGNQTFETDGALEVGTCRDLAARGAPEDYVADVTCPLPRPTPRGGLRQPWIKHTHS